MCWGVWSIRWGKRSCGGTPFANGHCRRRGFRISEDELTLRIKKLTTGDHRVSQRLTGGSHGAAVGEDVLVVLFDRLGEAVVALGVSDEVEVVALGRVHRGFE